MTVREDTVEEYLSKLGSRAPSPGGGAAAALTAAQGAALLSMVGHLSAGKVQDGMDWDAFIKRMDGIRDDFVGLAEEDARAFEHVMYCMNLAKGAEGRAERLEEALVGAAEPPLRIMELAAGMLPQLEPYVQAANAHVVSDAGIAVSLLRAAIESSHINVVINRKFMKVEANRERLNRRMEAVESAYRTLCDSLYRMAMDRIIGIRL